MKQRIPAATATILVLGAVFAAGGIPETSPADASTSPITMAMFGTTETVPGTNGDTWDTTWSANGTVYGMHNDGSGNGGPFVRNRLISLTGAPGAGTAVGNLNPGSLGGTIPDRYSSGLYEVGGVLYNAPNHSNQEETRPPDYVCCTFDSSFLISSGNGGATWNTPAGGTNPFFAYDWGQLNFVKYGQGGIAPAIDNADTYVYVFSNETSVDRGQPNFGYSGDWIRLARVLRTDLPALDPSAYQFYKGGNGALSSSWSSHIADSVPIVTSTDGRLGPATIVYNAALGRYLLSSYRHTQIPAGQGTYPDSGGQTLMEAEHPWGPWTPIMDESFASMDIGANDYLTWVFLDNNAWTSASGTSMWATVQPQNFYGLGFAPVYVTNQPVSTYHAEAASRTGSSVATSIGGYSGSGYATGIDTNGDAVRFAVNAANRGEYLIRFHYHSSDLGSRVGLAVNGIREQTIALGDTDALAAPWMTVTRKVVLDKGSNEIALRMESLAGDSGAFDLDKLDIAYYGATSLPERAPVTVNDNAGAVTYSAGWVYDNGASRASNLGGDIHYASTNGAWVEYAFIGTRAQVVNDVVDGLGTMSVTIDGSPAGTFSSDGTSTRRFQQTVYTTPVLPYGSHTLRLTKLDEPWASIDGFRSIAGQSVNDTAMSYDPSKWTYDAGPTRSANYSGDVHYTSVNGAAASYSFTGTGFQVVGDTDPSGLGNVDVYVDSQYVGTYHPLSPTPQYQEVLFEIRGMTNKPHTVRIVKKDGAWAVSDQLRVF